MTETVRNSLLASGATLYRINKETGVNRLTVRRFLDGAGINSAQLDKLATWLRLEVRPMAGDTEPTKPPVPKAKGRKRSE